MHTIAIVGASLAGLSSARALRDRGFDGRVVVIGGGFIGAEVAATARTLGLAVTVVEQQAVPLAGPLGAELGRMCAQLHGDHGVQLVTGTGVAGLAGTGRVRSVLLTDGRELPADVVVVGVGAVPNTEWLAGSGVELDRGVRTDASCATTVPFVVAAGDCAVTYHRRRRPPARRLPARRAPGSGVRDEPAQDLRPVAPRTHRRRPGSGALKVRR
jgi:3-phenylpropionate/trans-cinnamate dioxygenase ferredoxin reductase component